jgi:hypothetical protein
MKIKTLYRYRLVVSFLLLPLLLCMHANGQTYVSLPMTSTPAAGSYYSNSRIELKPNFSFAATAGSALHLYILPPGCVPQTISLSANQNYILTSVPQVGGMTSAASLINRGTCELM